MTHRCFSTGACALAVALVLALGAAGCGDSGDADAASGDDVAAQQIRANFKGILAGLGESDTAKVCAKLSPRAQKQTVAANGGSGTCEQAISELLTTFKQGLRRTGRIIGVRVIDDRAVVTVSTGRFKKTVRYAKGENGWQLDQSLIPG